MISKEQIKKEIDQMPDELVEQVYVYITDIKKTKKRKKPIHTYKLKGAFDRTDIRKKAYE